MNLVKTKPPLFIIGNPRSGTSLLRLILTSHSEILIPPECGFIIWLLQKYKDWSESDNLTVRLDQFLSDLFDCKKIDTWQLNKDFVFEIIKSKNPRNYSELTSSVYEAYGCLINKKFNVWGDKNNFHLNHLDELQELFNKAKFIHIIRDGRDVACSYREVMRIDSKSPYAPVLPIDIRTIANEWLNNVTKVINCMDKIGSYRSITIRYEDLVTNPEPLLRELCMWIGIEYEADMLEFYKFNYKNKLEPDKTLDWKKRTLEPISNDTVGQYKEILSNDEQREFLSVAKLALNKFRYQSF